MGRSLGRSKLLFLPQTLPTTFPMTLATTETPTELIPVDPTGHIKLWSDKSDSPYYFTGVVELSPGLLKQLAISYLQHQSPVTLLVCGQKNSGCNSKAQPLFTLIVRPGSMA